MGLATTRAVVVAAFATLIAGAVALVDGTISNDTITLGFALIGAAVFLLGVVGMFAEVER